jgi:hypothetical protein
LRQHHELLEAVTGVKEGLDSSIETYTRRECSCESSNNSVISYFARTHKSSLRLDLRLEAATQFPLDPAALPAEVPGKMLVEGSLSVAAKNSK